MVSTALVAAISAIAGSLITALVGVYSVRRQQRGQNRRKQAEFTLQKKTEILTELYEVLSECHAMLTPFVGHSEAEVPFDNDPSMSQLEEVNELTRELRTLIIKSGLYLSTERKNRLQLALIGINYALSDLTGERRRMTKEQRKFFEDAPQVLGLDESIEDYYVLIENAMDVLRKELNEPIEEITSSEKEQKYHGSFGDSQLSSSDEYSTQRGKGKSRNQ